jgi:uncharacterized protein involved in exopolysaccharide biosynthesis
VLTEETKEREISLVEVINSTTATIRYLFSKWYVILVTGFVLGLAGILYAWLQKPVYKAEITFAPETGKSSSLGVYAGIAAQFGLDMGGGSGGVFEGENLIEFLKSRMLIEKTLFSKVDIAGKQEILIDYYARRNKLYDGWKVKPELAVVDFTKEQAGLRERDSLLNVIVKDVRQTLAVGRVDKKLSIISASIMSEDEVFAKSFIEQLTINGIQYYIDYRSKKSRENVSILQRQFDSVRMVLSGNIVSSAASTDLNVNPTRQILKAGIQNRQIDIQANGQLYGELLKQLELSKIALQKETPFIEIIDRPRYPLEMTKMGRFRSGMLFAIVGGLLCCVFLLGRRAYKRLMLKSSV